MNLGSFVASRWRRAATSGRYGAKPGKVWTADKQCQILLEDRTAVAFGKAEVRFFNLSFTLHDMKHVHCSLFRRALVIP